MICEQCGLEIEDAGFCESCKACGKILCWNCINMNPELAYHCIECIVNK